MTPQELKNSILQLAIQGKLVEQRPEEGTAEELFKQIQAEKQALIKVGKIKKEKPLPEIAEDEKPFDIPDSWMWVYIGELFQHNTGKALNSSDKSGESYEYITTSNVYWNHFELEKLKTMLFTEAELEKFTVQKGDLLVLEGGDCGRAAIWSYDFPMRIQNHIHRLRPYGAICLEYFYYVFYLYKHTGMINGKGIAIQGLSANALHTLTAPLPPLAEQKRIVAKIEELLPLIDRYEEAWTKLEEFNKRFPGDMQKSLLQLAIQGKLVEQRPEEGTGEELYQKIQTEKQALIKSDKIKKDKPLPEIADDEKPFDIPESWKWVRWGEIVNIVSARRVHQSDWKSDGIPFYRAREIAKLAENGCVENELFISQDLFDEFSKSGVPQAGDLMVTAVGTLGKTYIVKSEDHFYYKDASVICFENFAGMLPEYLKYVMQSEMMKNQIKSNSDGTTVATLTMVRTVEYVLPLPPLDEQKRIVAKLEELLPLCEGLK